MVINYTAFGVGGTAKDPFDLGRTTTHEVGHWLNLRHIWGDDGGLADVDDPLYANLICSRGDFVNDTPNCSINNHGKPDFPHITCGNGPNGDLFYNYMDYSDDDITIMFTKGQVERMNAALAGPRSSLLGSDFSNIRAQTKTGLTETNDDSIHFLVHDWNKPGEKDLVAINKTEMSLQIMSAESKYQTNVFEHKSIAFKPTTDAANSELAFAFGNRTGDKKPDLFVVQSSPAETNLAVLSASSSYQKSTLDEKIKLRYPGPVYSIAVAPWTKGSEKPDLIVLQKPSIRFDSYSYVYTFLHVTYLVPGIGYIFPRSNTSQHPHNNSHRHLQLHPDPRRLHDPLPLQHLLVSRPPARRLERRRHSGPHRYPQIEHQQTSHNSNRPKRTQRLQGCDLRDGHAAERDGAKFYVSVWGLEW